MSLLVLAAIAGAFSAGGLWATQRLAKRSRARREREAEAKKPKLPLLEGLTLQLGDVVWVEGDERWLAGGLVGRDAGQIHGVVFVSPEGAEQRAVAVFPPPTREIFWLSPIRVECPIEPPGSLDVGGATFSRKSRAPVTLERLGQGAPRLGETAHFAVYEAAGGAVAVIVRSSSATAAWVGKRYEEGDYERLGAGDEG